MPAPYAWPLDPDGLVLVPALAVAYVLVVRRVPAERWRYASFAGGLLLVLAVFATPVETLALNYLVSAHFLQNVVVAEWAPALLVLGIPPALARRVHVPMLVALPLWLGTYFAWHVPVAYDFALRNPGTVLHLEHATYLIAGAMLWWPVVHGAEAAGAKALYLFAAFVLCSPLGLLLALVPHTLYAFYESRPTIWGVSHLLDQQIAGTTMAGEQAVVFFAVFTYFFLRFFREEERAGGFARYPSADAD
jgi:cytochrome c oxidase assembly factor CtaG